MCSKSGILNNLAAFCVALNIHKQPVKTNVSYTFFLSGSLSSFKNYGGPQKEFLFVWVVFIEGGREIEIETDRCHYCFSVVQWDFNNQWRLANNFEFVKPWEGLGGPQRSSVHPVLKHHLKFQTPNKLCYSRRHHGAHECSGRCA